MLRSVTILFVYCRASFDISVPGAKRKCLNEGEDPEEDVEEQKVSKVLISNQLFIQNLIRSMLYVSDLGSAVWCGRKMLSLNIRKRVDHMKRCTRTPAHF